MNRKSLLVIIVAVAVLVATGAVIKAQGKDQVRACAACAPPEGSHSLPSIPRGPMTIESVGETLSVLSFDDGTCESGLGAGTTQAVTDFVDFDVPTQCAQSGLQVVGLTTRVNTGQSASQFAFGQSGPTPPIAGGASLVPLTAAIPATGPCPATALTSRALNAPATITGTANFFAGMQVAGFAGRDTNGPPAGRIWLNCSFCGMTQYSPTDLSGIGLGGNWMIRVTVEDQNCVPVELMGFDVS